MKKTIVIFMALFFVVAIAPHIWAESVISEAKVQIEKEKHDTLVSKAKKLLERKEKIEAELSEIDKKLDKLDKGEDVTIEDPPNPNITGFYTQPYILR